jgi:hypothetical protein
MKNNSFYIDNNKMKLNLSMFLLLLTLNGCLSYTSFEDGKTIGKGKLEIMPSLNIHQAPSITFFDNENRLEDIPIIIYPNIAMSFKYGIGNKTDLYVRAATNLGINTGFKHQLIGDSRSKFALSTGADIGILLVPEILQDDYLIPNVQIPIYTSYHPSEKVSLYLTPRYVYQLKSGKDINDYHYNGGNFGVIYGKKNKIGLDLGIYSAQVRDLGRIHILNVGVGAKFFFE